VGIGEVIVIIILIGCYDSLVRDQYFVSRVAKEVMLVGDGAVRKLESFDKYIEAAHKRAAA